MSAVLYAVPVKLPSLFFNKVLSLSVFSRGLALNQESLKRLKGTKWKLALSVDNANEHVSK